MALIYIPVVGIPAPQGSKRHVGNGVMVESSKRVKPWRQDVREAALKFYHGPIIEDAVDITIVFIFPRPKSHYGTGKNAHRLKPSAPKYVTSVRNGDLEKLERSTYDGLSQKAGGTVLQDDSLVAKNSNEKRYCKRGEHPGAYIYIKKLKNVQQHLRAL